MTSLCNRRKLMASLAAVFSAAGAGTLMATRAHAKKRDESVRKLNRDGKPADGGAKSRGTGNLVGHQNTLTLNLPSIHPH